jgi:hypothetical protein
MGILVLATLGGCAAKPAISESLPQPDSKAPTMGPWDIQWSEVASTEVIVEGGCKRGWGEEILHHGDLPDEIVISCPRASYPAWRCALDGRDARAIFDLLHRSRHKVPGYVTGRVRIEYKLRDGRKLVAILQSIAALEETVIVQVAFQAVRIPFERWRQIRRIASGPNCRPLDSGQG